MKKIVFIMPNKGYSGAENVVIQIIRGINKEYDCYYVSEKGIISEYLEKYSIKHIVTDKNLDINELKKILETIMPDIVVATDYRASVKVSQIKGKWKIISHLHNNPSWIKKLNVKSLIFLISSIRFKKIFIVSESIKNEYIFSKLINKKMVNISNPISCEEIIKKSNKYSNKKVYDISFIGRFCEQKDPLKFLEIVSILKEKKPDLKVLMIGSGSWSEKVKEWIDKMELNKYIDLKGFQSEPYKYMKSSKLICIPSKYEGFGLVAFEALTLGIPVLATPVGGLVDIINEESGFLLKENEDFANIAFELLNDKKKYISFSTNAVKRSKEIENYKDYIKKIKSELNKI